MFRPVLRPRLVPVVYRFGVLTEPSSSNDSDSSDDRYYIRKRCKKKRYRKNDPIKLCTNLTEKLLTTAYKSKIVRFKMDEDPLQRRIYFLKFVESPEMIFSQYTETCEVLLDYPKIGGDDIIEDFAKKAIRNLLHSNIDVHSRRLIAEFPRDGIKCIEKLQSHCANMNFADKVDMAGLFNKSHIKEGNLQSITSRGFRMHMPYQFR